jgi:hypothetical protein
MKKFLFVAMLFMCGMGAIASAQMTTTITVKNSTAYTMNFSLHGSTLSKSIEGTASPTPANVAIQAGSSFVFVVTSPYPDIAAAHFYFENTGVYEGCKFDTSYTTLGSWTSGAASSGLTSISCSAKLTVNSFTTHDYSVLFTL